MLRIGITGGIGSGKSTVAKVFEVLGIPVYYADSAAKRIMQEDPELIAELSLNFGDKIYKNGILDRVLLSSIVFNNPQKLELLNAIVHPATIKAGIRWMEAQTSPYVLKEAALIFESGSQENLDFIIGVNSPLPLRIKRVMDRDKITREQVQHRMNNQIDESIKMRLCDAIIENNEHELIIPQVLTLHQRFLDICHRS